MDTSDLSVKKTSPTLAEFKNPATTVPDWRLQLQNTVRQRTGRDSAPETIMPVASARSAVRAALKHEVAPSAAQAVSPRAETDIMVANALKRIEQSRRIHLPSEKAREGMRVAKAAAGRAFPFNVVSRSADAAERPAASVEPSPAIVRPKLISSIKIEKKEYDTNKLTPIPEAEYMSGSGVADPAGSFEDGIETETPLSEKLEIKAALEPEPQAADAETDDTDDLAPISMRFNAGLFDVIIGVFATGIVTSPLFAFSEEWLTLSGGLIFVGAFMAVMFLYLTASLAFLGQSFGMKLFSLELVDAEESEFPTLHQAAVNSSVFLLSLITCGIGFVTILFNEEKRAIHDLISGTILVREV
jgi:uncharacterized RDD family membrane protein YckC